MSKRAPLPMLKPRIAEQPDRLPTGANWRSGKTSSAARGYGYRWQKARLRFLRENPMCVMCRTENPISIEFATVVDHVVPHRGDERLFWDESNWAALCKPHHDSKTQREGRP